MKKMLVSKSPILRPPALRPPVLSLNLWEFTLNFLLLKEVAVLFQTCQMIHAGQKSFLRDMNPSALQQLARLNCALLQPRFRVLFDLPYHDEKCNGKCQKP